MTVRDLAAVRRRRLFPTAVTQAVQRVLQRQLLGPLLRGADPTPPAALFELIRQLPWLSVVPAYFIGVGSGPSTLQHSPAAHPAARPPARLGRQPGTDIDVSVEKCEVEPHAGVDFGGSRGGCDRVLASFRVWTREPDPYRHPGRSPYRTLGARHPAKGHTEVEVAAVAARDASRGRAFAAKHRIPRVHESYDALIADPDLNAVYIPLPNGLHGRWTRAALAAGRCLV